MMACRHQESLPYLGGSTQRVRLHALLLGHVHLELNTHTLAPPPVCEPDDEERIAERYAIVARNSL